MNPPEMLRNERGERGRNHSTDVGASVHKAAGESGICSGYLVGADPILVRELDEHARVAVDYQFKPNVTFNDDKVNTRLAVTWGMTF